MPATFSDFTSYKNGRSGAIASKIGDVRFVNFSVADNKRAGIEASEVMTARNTAVTSGALIIGHSGNQEPSELLNTGEVGVIGFWAPQDENYTLTDTVLANFDVDGYAGGLTVHVSLDAALGLRPGKRCKPVPSAFRAREPMWPRDERCRGVLLTLRSTLQRCRTATTATSPTR